MSISLVADFTQTRNLAGLLRQAGRVLADPAPLLTDIGNALVQSARERFDSQTDPSGRKWTPLAPETKLSRMGGTRRVFTKRMKFRKGAAEKMARLTILFQQGHLRNSITRRVSRSGVEIGTNRVYAAIHQFGGKAGRGQAITIPARAYLGLSAADEGRVEALIQSYLRSVMP